MEHSDGDGAERWSIVIYLRAVALEPLLPLILQLKEHSLQQPRFVSNLTCGV